MVSISPLMHYNEHPFHQGKMSGHVNPGHANAMAPRERHLKHASSPPSLPDDASYTHQLKRQETLHRTLSASNTYTKPHLGNITHGFPMSFKDSNIAPLVRHGDSHADQHLPKTPSLCDDVTMEEDSSDVDIDESDTSSPRTVPMPHPQASKLILRENTLPPARLNHQDSPPPSFRLPSIKSLIGNYDMHRVVNRDRIASKTGDWRIKRESQSPSPPLSDKILESSIRSGQTRELSGRRECRYNTTPEQSKSTLHPARFYAEEYDYRSRTDSPSSPIDDPFSLIKIESTPSSPRANIREQRDIRPSTSSSSSTTLSQMSSPGRFRSASGSSAPYRYSLPSTPQSSSNAQHWHPTPHLANVRDDGSPATSTLASRSDARPATTLRIKDEWKTHAVTLPGPQDVTVFKCTWASADGQCCGYTAKRHLVKRHIETRHLQIKDHICPVPSCGKAFPQRNSLQIHLNRHTGNKPHACRYDCGMSFNDPARRHKHMVDVHGYVPQGPRKRHRTAGNYASFEAIAPWSIQADGEDDEEEE
ncbi:hypothetical protein BD410DRAFT_834117 [Rickenella mellea]|uniref:C2H2-type domain-containing protein n=1 Tax=Rickenella mellea TaxID=50990 RepID=A0A4R5XFD9_9AGAM|nr:hypothetical protein BD410DRAFT_834117 [Rickenella mellea]